MAIDDAGNDVGQIAVRLDPEELAAFDQRGNDSPMLGTAIGAGEERVFARQGKRPNGNTAYTMTMAAVVKSSMFGVRPGLSLGPFG